MLLNHLAAVLVFSGPLFYIGLFMAVFPAAFARLPKSFVRGLKNFRDSVSGLPSPTLIEPEHSEISVRIRRVVRLAGVTLVLFAVVV